jgi:hypothetical protein
MALDHRRKALQLGSKDSQKNTLQLSVKHGLRRPTMTPRKDVLTCTKPY